MCKKCGKSSCSGCSKSTSSSQDVAAIKNEMQELHDKVALIEKNTKFLECGHPILILQNVNDISAFNSDTGLGSECWEGWAICNGAEHYSESEEANITVPNLLDRFIVSAGEDYEVGDTGGSDEVTLTEAELPAHSHAITDPGHLHAINDSGHSHGTVVGNHTHTITIAPHTHVIDDDGAHTHNYQTIDEHVAYDGSGDAGASLTELTEGINSQQTTLSGGVHTHTAQATTATAGASSESIAVAVSSANTGIEIVTGTTGITLSETGDGESHENRPRYYAVLFVMKL